MRADGEVDRDRPWRDRRRSPSDSLAWFEETLLMAGVATRLGEGDDILRVGEGGHRRIHSQLAAADRHQLVNVQCSAVQCSFCAQPPRLWSDVMYKLFCQDVSSP